MLQSPGPIALQIGPISIHWYGVIIGAGILLCYWYAMHEAKRRGLSEKPIDDMAFWVILAGVIGARLYYVLFNISYYAANPTEILQIWKGGLAIHGALLFGAAAYFLYCARHKLSAFLYADVIIPGILLAQALGRWGNFFNNEAFGTPTNLSWKLFIPEANRPEGFTDFAYFHPTFLYESLWNLLGFFLLIFLSRKFFPRTTLHHTPYKLQATHSSGPILFSYLVFYSFGRFFIESLRTDSLYLGPLRIAQVVSVILFLIGFFGLLFFRRKSTI